MSGVTYHVWNVTNNKKNGGASEVRVFYQLGLPSVVPKESVILSLKVAFAKSVMQWSGEMKTKGKHNEGY